MVERSDTVENELWGIQKPYITDALTDINTLYQAGPPAYSPENQVAAQDVVATEGLDAAAVAARGALTDLSSGQTGLLTGILNATDPGTLRAAAMKRAQAASGAGAGPFGGYRSQYAGQKAAQDAILDRQLQASTQVQQAQANALAPGQTLTNIGLQNQAQTQREIDERRNRYDYEQNKDRQWAEARYGLLSGQGINPTTTTTTSNKTSGVEKLLGGISAAKGIYDLYNYFKAQGGPVGYNMGGAVMHTPMEQQRDPMMPNNWAGGW